MNGAPLALALAAAAVFVSAARRGSRDVGPSDDEDGLLRNRDGTPRVLYHQTAPQARQAIGRQGFRIDKIRNRGADKEMPDGVFVKLTPDPLGVGGAQVPVTVRITNPLHVRDRDQLRDWLTRESPEYGRARLDAETVDWEHKALWEAAWNNPPKRGPSTDPRAQKAHVEHMARLKQITDAWSAASDEASAAVRAVVTSALLAHGYDSLWMKRDEGTRGRAVETLVVLDPRRVTVHHP